MTGKKSKVKRLLSLLLCLSMVLSMLPIQATMAATPDGAIDDTWVQDPDTVLGTGGGATKEDGKLHVSAGTGNGNAPAGPNVPAVFENETMNTALATALAEDGEAWLKVTFTMLQEKADSRFGVYLNYEDPNNGLFIGGNASGWYWQRYVTGGGDDYGSYSVAIPNVNESATLYLKWTETGVSEVKINDVSVTASKELTYPNKDGVPSSIGFSASGWSADIHTEYYLSNLTYSGQGTKPDPEPEPGDSANVADGAIHDAWVQEAGTVLGSGSIVEVRDGVLWLGAGDGNGNGQSSTNGTGTTAWPALFVNETMNTALGAVGADQPSFLEFTLTRKSEHANNHTQFGVYINYQDPGNGFYVGCDASGWFWQNYKTGGANSYYTGNPRQELLPAVGKPVTVRLEWTGTSLTLATVDGRSMFPNLPHDFSDAGGSDTSRGKIAFKAGRWNNVSTVYTLSDVTYSGQAEVMGYNVSGTVVDKDGAPMAGVTVTGNGASVVTDENGAYLFTGSSRFTNGEYPLTFAREGYGTVTKSITVAGAVVAVEAVALKAYPSVTGKVIDEEGNGVAGAAVSIGDKGAVTGADGSFTILGVAPGSYTLTASADGYEASEGRAITVEADTDLNVGNIALEALGGTITLSSDKMNVLLDQSFPRVITYTMKSGKVFYGQNEVLTALRINGADVVPTVTSVVKDNTVTYTMAFDYDGGDANATITAVITVEGNVLTLDITDVAYGEGVDKLVNPIESIMIPNHSLISVRSTQAGADLAAARLAADTRTSGDSYVDVNAGLNVNSWNGQAYMYVFLSNDQLSAGISSNSDVGTGSASSNNHRVTVTARDTGAYKTVGAGSSLWYFDRKITSSNDSYGHNTAQQALNNGAPLVVGIRDGIDEMPYVKVVIADDENGDNEIDWQDGAIAARDQEVIHIPDHSEGLADLVTTRIVENFQSQATYPFLTTLDNVKRVALHSDGLGQSVLLKGYANEGHDSGHPDYYDIGTRLGGVEDMLVLLKEGQEYGAEFGIHVNASEFYPEAKAFGGGMIYRTSAADDAPVRYGWNWLDQGIMINGLYDLATGSRNDRFQQLWDKVGNELDYIYVDVWGNLSNGCEDAWQTRKMSNEITSKGWRIVHEWGFANEWNSTFQHWVSDFTYGASNNKGKLNSAIMRFMLNGNKDSFVPDFPTYGGATNAPLLGGPSMQGFEGWQNDMEYDLFIDNLYNQMIPTKFLQHYDVMDWVNASQAVSIPYGNEHGSYSESTKSSWIPEVQITLQDDARQATVVVTRGSDEEINDVYKYGTQAERIEYRSRTITLNGKVILRGAADPGDFTGNAPQGNMEYLIPWYWDSNGAQLSVEDEKLYHYTLTGGASTWELPEGWGSLSTVVLYELTDQGRANPVTVAVTNGSITLDTQADTPYVVVKGEDAGQAPTVEWSTGGHLSDMSFIGKLEESWDVTGEDTVSVVKTSRENPMLCMTGEGSVSQELTGLTPGTRYAVYVGVDNRSDAKALITLTDADGNVLDSNYTLRSIARNYVGTDPHHNGHATEEGASYFQNMYVYFNAPENGGVTLTLSREAGEGNSYFDDVRVVANRSQYYSEDGKVFTQDFEHSAQGLYPFVFVSGGPGDGRVHLSERHGEFTQSGWEAKRLDDVLGDSDSSNWSVKANNQTQQRNLIIRTIPQNFHFEPGVTYTVSFDYQMGSPDIYQLAYGVGEFNRANTTFVDLQTSIVADRIKSETHTCTFTIIGDESGQSWFGIYSTNVGRDSMGVSGSAADFGGYGDFILDNVVIAVSDVQKAELSELVAKGNEMVEMDYAGDWEAFEAALADATEILNKLDATQGEVDTAADTLDAAIKALTKLETSVAGTVTDSEGNPVAGATVVLEDGEYLPMGPTATTDAEGKFVIEELSALSYNLKITADGCYVATVNTGVLTAGIANPVDVELTAREEVTYTNDFEDGDVSMMVPLQGDSAGDEVAAIEFNGSTAAQITFKNGGSSIRNNIVDDNIQMTNGTIEMDVTALTTGARVGVTLRGQSQSQRFFVGHFDNVTGWGMEGFGTDGGYSRETAGPGLATGVTRNIRITVNGTRISMWVDGVQVYNGTNFTPLYETMGYVGLNSSRTADNKVVVDNLRITPLHSETNPDAVLTSIKLTEPEKKVYNMYEQLDLTGLVVTAVYSDGVERAVSNYTVAGFESYMSGEKSVIVTYTEGEKSVTEQFKVNVIPVVVSLSVTGPDKVEYVVGEELDLTGLTVTATYSEGDPKAVDVADCEVTGFDPAIEGEQTVTVSYTDNGVTKSATFTVTVVPPFPIVPVDPVDPEPGLPFVDVPEGGWSYDAISYVYENGIMNGVSKTEFAPQSALNRAMLAQILYNLEGKPAYAGGSAFTDVSDGAWYADAVAWAAGNDIVKGYGDNTFGPLNDLTREQMVLILYRYAQYKGHDVTGRGDLSQFTDGSLTASWAKDAMEWALSAKLINGKGNGILAPKSASNRAEVAKVMQNYCEGIGKE